MNFLAPLMLLGVLGVAVPIVIHLYGRRRAPIKKFGAIDFLLGTNRRVARRLRVRELLLLALRVLACLAIPLALAKPLVSCSAAGPAIQRGPQAVAIVIDNSFTMGWRRPTGGGETLFARAKDRALRVLDQLGPEADVVVVFTAEGEGSSVDQELSRDHIKLADLIGDAKLTARPGNTSQALRRAAGLLASSPLTAKRVYLFSAISAPGFPPGDPPWPPGAGPELHVEDVTDGQPLANVAITAARAEKDPDLGARGVRVTAEISNYGPTAVTDLGVTLRLGSRAVARGLLTLGAGEGQSKRFSVTLPADAQASEAVVEIDADGLVLDDRRWLRVELVRDVRVLVVDGDPRTVRRDDETFYLETALRPGDRADSALAITSTTVDDLPRRRLADFDVIFLVNVKPLDRARADELAAWVRKGGGLFVSVGDNVDGDAYEATMAPLLAQQLRTARSVGGTTAAERIARAERIGRFEANHPIFAVFSAKAPELREARFWKIFLVGPSSRTEKRRILARFESGAPALIEAPLDKGRLLLFLSTLDRDWNDLPIHIGFLPFVQQAARYLARSPTRDEPSEVLVGRARDLPVRADDTRVEVTSPSGKKYTFEGEKLRGRQTVAFADTAEPGLFRVAAVSTEGAARARPSADFVVNVDPRGSDVRKVAPESLPTGTPIAGTAASSGTTNGKRRVELWHGLAAALLIFLLGESILNRR